MAELKFNISVLSGTGRISTKANTINADFNKSEIGENRNLSAANKYIDYETKIKKLLSEYRSLVRKDVQDLNNMLAEIQLFDSKIKTAIARAVCSTKGGGGGGAF